ncbi:hypothetical protein [Wolbachia endosymbiont (group E) of Neria commutata]|uniref:hypothetical protein n=1 Tax=Wolbachia endosymbiont (group E) of Neria commutata TaxID=3066149 RepID=UPI003132CDF5
MLSFFNPFTIKRIWDNYDSEFCNSMLQKNDIRQFGRGYPSYTYPDVMRLFSKPYFTNANKRLLDNLTAAGVSIGDIEDIFFDQEQVNRLNSVNQDLLKLLIKVCHRDTKNVLKRAN